MARNRFLLEFNAELTINDIEECLKSAHPNAHISITNLSQNNQNGLLTTSPSSAEIDVKDERIKELETTINKLNKSIKAFHIQQQALFEEFVTLRNKYDEHKSSLLSTLWEETLPYHPDLQSLPKFDLDNPPKEGKNGDVYGQYKVDDILGDGQFAVVKTCTRIPSPSLNNHTSNKHEHDTINPPSIQHPHTQHTPQHHHRKSVHIQSPEMQQGDGHMAIKIINKEKLLSINALKRLSCEIKVLYKLQNKYIIQLYDVIHTQSYVCLIMERGGGKTMFK